jgi:hypothetical protein
VRAIGPIVGSRTKIKETRGFIVSDKAYDYLYIVVCNAGKEEHEFFMLYIF